MSMQNAGTSTVRGSPSLDGHFGRGCGPRAKWSRCAGIRRRPGGQLADALVAAAVGGAGGLNGGSSRFAGAALCGDTDTSTDTGARSADGTVHTSGNTEGAAAIGSSLEPASPRRTAALTKPMPIPMPAAAASAATSRLWDGGRAGGSTTGAGAGAGSLALDFRRASSSRIDSCASRKSTASLSSSLTLNSSSRRGEWRGVSERRSAIARFSDSGISRLKDDSQKNHSTAWGIAFRHDLSVVASAMPSGACAWAPRFPAMRIVSNSRAIIGCRRPHWVRVVSSFAWSIGLRSWDWARICFA